MNVVIVGCGKIGRILLEDLVSEGHDVVAVDNNQDVLTNVTNIYDIMAVCGNGANHDILSEASVQNAELLIAVTGSDELNMLCCFLAKRMGAKHTIARIRNPEYNDKSLGFMRQQLDISLAINPEFLAAKELYSILKLPAAAKIETFSVRNFEIIELKLKADSVLDGMRLIDMRNKYAEKFLICAVQRGDDAYIPDGNFILRSGDKICLTATRTEIIKLLKELGILQKKAKSIMILGGSTTAFYLAKMLTASGSKVTVIEKDAARCEELCENLPAAIIVNGDGAQQELLLEEGINSVDAFVALTGMDEANILISAFAETMEVPKVIAKVNREELISLAENLQVDSIVSPKRLVADVMLRYARALESAGGSSVETLYKIMDDKVEVLEFKVNGDFPQLNIPFKELKTKPNTLFAGIIRDRKTIIPSGDDMLLAGDKVVVLAANQRINNLSDILK